MFSAISLFAGVLADKHNPNVGIAHDFGNWTFVSVSGMIKTFWELPELSFNLSAFSIKVCKGPGVTSPGYSVPEQNITVVIKTGVEAK
jgi:hypothetical protein